MSMSDSWRLLLAAARQKQVAIGAFNIFNELTARAAIKAAEALEQPLILQTSVSTVRQIGVLPLIGMMKNLKSQARVPVLIHLDHCTDPDLAIQCARAGWDSVMIDASKEPIEENIRITRMVREAAGKLGVAVEGEIGVISGVEDHIVAETGTLTGLAETLHFVAETGIDAVAPAIGTAHGVYKGVPVINFDLVADLARKTDCPIVIHGGTGLEAEVFRRLVRLGASKINVSTAIKRSYLGVARSYLQANPEADNPLKLDLAIEKAVQETVREHLLQFDAR